MHPHIIFTTDEEVGARGAYKLATINCPFKDCRYIIELDRRGANDCVFYDCENPEFTAYVEQFGFEEDFGTFSDISVLCPAWGIAGVNLSIGYRDEHTACEILNVNHMLATIEKVKKMLTVQDIPFFKYIPNPYPYASLWGLGASMTHGNDVLKCAFCGKYHMEEELFPIVMQDSTTKYCCPECISEEVAWCTNCYSGYEKLSPEAPIAGLCPHCVNKEKKNDTKRDSRAL